MKEVLVYYRMALYLHRNNWQLVLVYRMLRLSKQDSMWYYFCKRFWLPHLSDTWEYFQGNHTYMTSTNIPYWKTVCSSFVTIHNENKDVAVSLLGHYESAEGGVLQWVCSRSLRNHIVNKN
jgi:hypothetical protein